MIVVIFAPVNVIQILCVWKRCGNSQDDIDKSRYNTKIPTSSFSLSVLLPYKEISSKTTPREIKATSQVLCALPALFCVCVVVKFQSILIILFCPVWEWNHLEVSVKSRRSHSYLTDVTTAKVWWHLSNVNAILKSYHDDDFGKLEK